MPDLLAGKESVGDGGRVMALHPAVRGHIAAALAVGARVHHHEAVSMTKQEFRMADVAGAIVLNAVVEKHPVAIRLTGAMA